MSSPDPEAPNRLCNFSNCTEPAGYKAPKSRTSQAGYYWFCLKHIRQYNSQWDFFKGMNAEDIQNKKHASFYWDRPTWNRSTHPKIFSNPDFEKDILNFKTSSSSSNESAPKAISEALTCLNLEWPITKDDLQKKYRFYAKKYHPDVNPNNKTAEKQFKKINKFYHDIKKFLEKN